MCAWLSRGRTSSSWSTPARWTPSRTSTCWSVSGRGTTSLRGPTSTAAPTGETGLQPQSAALLMTGGWSLSAVCPQTCSFLCRSVTLDGSNRASVLQLSHKTEVLMQTSATSFLLVREPFPQKLPSSRSRPPPAAFASLCSTKCTRCRRGSSPWTTWNQRCSVSPLTAASPKTGVLLTKVTERTA